MLDNRSWTRSSRVLLHLSAFQSIWPFTQRKSSKDSRYPHRSNASECSHLVWLDDPNAILVDGLSHRCTRQWPTQGIMEHPPWYQPSWPPGPPRFRHPLLALASCFLSLGRSCRLGWGLPGPCRAQGMHRLPWPLLCQLPSRDAL